jgi:hypothetical protein
MDGRIFILSILATALTGCALNTTDATTLLPTCDTAVKYEWDDVNQETRKTTEYLNAVTDTCSEMRLQLTNYESGLDVRRRAKVTCKPQSIASVWLKADSNFYSYRNGRVLMELDSSTGQFRRLTLGETTDGQPAVSKDLGCFFVRTDTETEPVDPQDYGSQLLLDLGPLAASTELVRPIEIFKYSISSNAWQTTRFDQNFDIDFSFCPASMVPWRFCTALRNGNPYFEPVLDAATEADLLQQALLIRSEYNYATITQAEFQQMWDQAEKSYLESPIQSWVSATTTFVDVPDYVWSAWADYVRGNLPTMPDAYAINLPPMCYQAQKDITLSDGSTGVVSGQACYDGSGGYEFQ